MGGLRGRAVRRRPWAARTRLYGAWRRGAAVAGGPALPSEASPSCGTPARGSGPVPQLQRAAGAAKGAAPGCLPPAPRRAEAQGAWKGAGLRARAHASDHAGDAAVRRTQQLVAGSAARPGGGSAALTSRTPRRSLGLAVNPLSGGAPPLLRAPRVTPRCCPSAVARLCRRGCAASARFEAPRRAEAPVQYAAQCRTCHRTWACFPCRCTRTPTAARASRCRCGCVRWRAAPQRRGSCAHGLPAKPAPSRLHACAA